MRSHARHPHRSSLSLLLAGLASAVGAPRLAAAAEPVQWLGGPWVLEASPARNPDVDERGGQVHIVHRVRDGGIGHITGSSMGSPTVELVIPGSVTTAAVTRPWNLPRVAVDDAGAGHVVWGPLSTSPTKGAWYAKIGADGVPAIEAHAITTRWVEDLDVTVIGDEVHVLVNAIGDTPGVYDLHGSVDTGPTAEVQVSLTGTLRELSAHRHETGVTMVGRFTQIGRADLSLGGAWGAVTTSPGPGAPFSSVGFPRLVRGETDTWATMAWIDATPSTVMARSARDPWEPLSVDAPFDPDDADGGSPSIAMARDFEGRVAVAWLAASGDRLRVAVADPEWSMAIALPGTADVTSFELCADGEALRAVFVTDDGTLHTGRLGVPAAPPDDDTDGGATSGDPNDGGTDQGATGEVPGVDDGSGDATGADGSGTSEDTDDAVDRLTGWAGSPTASGCACRHAADGEQRSAWMLAWLLLATSLRRRRVA